MGTTYKIRCKHCGSKIDRFVKADFGVLPMGMGCGCGYVETETAIRCPACHSKLNTTKEEFQAQVEVSYVWD